MNETLKNTFDTMVQNDWVIINNKLSGNVGISVTSVGITLSGDTFLISSLPNQNNNQVYLFYRFDYSGNTPDISSPIAILSNNLYEAIINYNSTYGDVILTSDIITQAITRKGEVIEFNEDGEYAITCETL